MVPLRTLTAAAWLNSPYPGRLPRTTFDCCVTDYWRYRAPPPPANNRLLIVDTATAWLQRWFFLPPARRLPFCHSNATGDPGWWTHGRGCCLNDGGVLAGSRFAFAATPLRWPCSHLPARLPPPPHTCRRGAAAAAAIAAFTFYGSLPPPVRVVRPLCGWPTAHAALPPPRCSDVPVPPTLTLPEPADVGTLILVWWLLFDYDDGGCVVLCPPHLPSTVPSPMPLLPPPPHTTPPHTLAFTDLHLPLNYPTTHTPPTYHTLPAFTTLHVCSIAHAYTTPPPLPAHTLPFHTTLRTYTLAPFPFGYLPCTLPALPALQVLCCATPPTFVGRDDVAWNNYGAIDRCPPLPR